MNRRLQLHPRNAAPPMLLILPALRSLVSPPPLHPPPSHRLRLSLHLWPPLLQITTPTRLFLPFLGRHSLPFPPHITGVIRKTSRGIPAEHSPPTSRSIPPFTFFTAASLFRLRLKLALACMLSRHIPISYINSRFLYPYRLSPTLQRHPGATYNAPRTSSDLYTPRFVRGRGRDKVGVCPVCVEPVARGGEGRVAWLSMKFSAFKWCAQVLLTIITSIFYHSFSHGSDISPLFLYFCLSFSFSPLVFIPVAV